MEKDIVTRIHDSMGSFSKGQRAIARYIGANYDKAAFMTAGKLGQEAGVSESTVVRFAMVMGYEGYPQFQEAMAGYVKEKLHSVHKIDLEEFKLNQGELIDYVLNGDMLRIQDTIRQMDRTAFHEAIERILDARRVYVVGLRSCSCLAQLLGFYLNLIVPQVQIVNSNNSSELFEQMLRLDEQDVVIGISFPRYSMRTLKILEFANNRKASVIAITDSTYSPLTIYSSCNLCARSEMSSVAESLTAAMSLINAMIMALSIRRKTEVIASMETLESLWHDYTYDDADELDLLRDDVAEKLNRLEKQVE